MEHHQRLAILVGGGPAPGINSVIAAATIRARLEGLDVVGIRDGFEWLMQGDIDHVTPLTIEDVSRIHFRGGSRPRTPPAHTPPGPAPPCPAPRAPPPASATPRIPGRATPTPRAPP